MANIENDKRGVITVSGAGKLDGRYSTFRPMDPDQFFGALDVGETQTWLITMQRDTAMPSEHEPTLEELLADLEKCVFSSAITSNKGDIWSAAVKYRSAIIDRDARIRAELQDHEQSFDLRWASDMRAIKRWQETHPGNDLTWPDHTDLSVWLLEQLQKAEAERDQAIVERDAANTRQQSAMAAYKKTVAERNEARAATLKVEFERDQAIADLEAARADFSALMDEAKVEIQKAEAERDQAIARAERAEGLLRKHEFCDDEYCPECRGHSEHHHTCGLAEVLAAAPTPPAA